MSGELDTDWRGYRGTVARHAKDDTLMTLQTLSSSFPADSAQAGQAYAQSGSVVEFIIQNYGQEAMAQLLEIFSEGALYDDALEEALSVDTWGLDNAWRDSLDAAPLEVPASSGEAVPSTPEPAPAPTQAPVVEEPPVEAAATPAAPEPEEPSAPAGGGLALPCLGSILTGAAVLGLFFLFRPQGTGAG